MSRSKSFSKKNVNIALQMDAVKSNFYKTGIDRLYLYINKHPLLTAIATFIISALYVVIFISQSTITFAVNDNTAILDIIMQDSDVFFMPFAAGRIFSFLYLNVSQNVPWFGYALFASIIISQTLFVLSILKLERLKYFMPVILAAMFIFFSQFIIMTGYNSAGILAGASSIAIMTVLLSESQKPKFIWVAVLGVQFAFSYFFRGYATLAVLSLVFPFIIFMLLTNFKTSFTPYLVFLIPFLMLFGANSYIKHYDLSEQTQDYIEFNSYRGQFHAFPIASENVGNEKILKANDWTEYDYELLRRWIYHNEERFTTTTIKNIFKYASVKEKDKLDDSKISFELRKLFTSYKQYYILLLAIIVLSIASNRKLGFGLVLMYVAYISGMSIYLELFMRFPSRIGAPMLYGSAAMALIAMNLNFRKFESQLYKSNRFISAIVAILAIIMIAYSSGLMISHLLHTIERNSIGQKNFERNWDALNHQYEGKVLLFEPGWGGIDPRYQNPLKTYKQSFHRVPVGWTIFSEYSYNILQDIGVEQFKDLYPFSIDNKDFYYFLSNNTMYILLHQIKNLHGVHCRAELVHKASKHLGIYRLGTDKNADSSTTKFSMYIPNKAEKQNDGE